MSSKVVKERPRMVCVSSSSAPNCLACKIIGFGNNFGIYESMDEEKEVKRTAKDGKGRGRERRGKRKRAIEKGRWRRGGNIYGCTFSDPPPLNGQVLAFFFTNTTTVYSLTLRSLIIQHAH